MNRQKRFANYFVYAKTTLTRTRCQCIVVNYADTLFSNFANEFLCENETVHETVFAGLCGDQVESFKQNKCRKSCDTLWYDVCVCCMYVVV